MWVKIEQITEREGLLKNNSTFWVWGFLQFQLHMQYALKCVLHVIFVFDDALDHPIQDTLDCSEVIPIYCSYRVTSRQLQERGKGFGKMFLHSFQTLSVTKKRIQQIQKYDFCPPKMSAMRPNSSALNFDQGGVLDKGKVFRVQVFQTSQSVIENKLWKRT